MLATTTRGGEGDRYLDAARELGPRIAGAADWIERERRLPDDLVADMDDAGLFRMLLPASLGGAELDLASYARVVEELARADGSVAWCVGQASGLSAVAAYLEPAVARSIFVETRPGILANGPGERNRPGCAVAVDGGYRVSGRWNFASGCRHATWLQAICQVESSDGRPTMAIEGEPNVRLMLFPKEQATLIDTWQVSGLRGTGSFSFSVDGLFVPEPYAACMTRQSRRERGALYLSSSSGMFGPSFGSVALGIAASMLEALIGLARDKTPRGLGRTVRESQTVQSVVARAHARLSAARLLLQHTLREVRAESERAGALDVSGQVRVRLASTHATHEAAAAADAAYAAAGSTAIFADQPFERRFRDIHAVTQQLQGRAAHYETVGRYLLGLDPDSPFL
ncbi:MAG: acyl-CoA dehydrogenase family protein [Chloroflexota bacterium]|nr:acyl-CoA dehydrogenase family protein [Chloroflexota bacterium]